jgi:flap endonuclease-1
MGIHNLNKFLMEKCKKANIRKTHLSDLSGKTIAIDTSIYLYKFMADNTLIEHFYLMISLFRHYNIVPIFVFDGKPPKAKRELLSKRRQHRKESEEQYNKLKEEYEAMNDSSDEKVELRKELDLLKRESTSISYDNLATTKALISAYGAKYEQAEGEADVLCLQLVKSGKVWGCMSDDMDMFVYGCPRVFRHFSLVNHSVIFYDFSAMLSDLEMDIQTFREIAVLSGTDYNCDNKTSLGETVTLYEKYKTSGSADESTNDFYDWVLHNSNYISDIETLRSIVKMFDVTNYSDNLAILDRIDQVTFEEINISELHAILEKDGFVFVQ